MRSRFKLCRRKEPRMNADKRRSEAEASSLAWLSVFLFLHPRSSAFICGFFLLLLSPQPALAESQIPARKPNIVFILADDLGYGDLGCYGQQQIKTPNIDRMAAEGMRFTKCYAGTTVCAPSRACLM